jgi:hypothetical protein
MNNRNGFISDRYTSYSEKIHFEEIEKIKAMKREDDEMSEYGRNYR